MKVFGQKKFQIPCTGSKVPHLRAKFGMYFAQPSFSIFEWCDHKQNARHRWKQAVRSKCRVVQKLRRQGEVGRRSKTVYLC